MPCTRATSGRKNSNRFAFASPPCGPVDVTTVPVTTTNVTATSSARPVHRTDGNSTGRAGGVGLACSTDQDQGVREQRQRQEEVCGDQLGAELEENREASEDGLREDADHEADRQPDEVTPARDAHQRSEDAHDDGNRDKAREQPVEKLDHRVDVGAVARRELPRLARRPVGAAET